MALTVSDAPGVRALATTDTGAATSASPQRASATASFSDGIAGTQAQPFDRTAMEMAYLVYHEDVGPGDVAFNAAVDDLEARTGWRMLDANELSALGYSSQAIDRLYQPGEQFRAAVFADGDGNYMLAFRGTGAGAETENEAQDWLTNLAQGAGLPTTEYDRIVPAVIEDFTGTLGRRDDDGGWANLGLTGHSQGGGLASFGAALSGVPAITFDASGVHDATLARHGLDADSVRESAADGLVRAYTIDGEALDTLQTTGPLPSLTGALFGPLAQLGELARNRLIGAALPDALGHEVALPYRGGDLADDAIAYATGMPDWAASAITIGVRTLFGPLGNDVMNVADSAYKHHQQTMLDAMDQNTPWSPRPTLVDVVGAGVDRVDGAIDAVQHAATQGAQAHGPVVRAIVAIDNAAIDVAQVVGGAFVEAGATVAENVQRTARSVVDTYLPMLRPLML